MQKPGQPESGNPDMKLLHVTQEGTEGAGERGMYIFLGDTEIEVHACT